MADLNYFVQVRFDVVVDIVSLQTAAIPAPVLIAGSVCFSLALTRLLISLTCVLSWYPSPLQVKTQGERNRGHRGAPVSDEGGTAGSAFKCVVLSALPETL